MSKDMNPTMRNINKYGSQYGFSMHTIREKFGNLAQAKLAANLNAHKNKYQKDEVVEKLKLIHNKYNGISKEILEKEQEIYVNHKTVVRLWGSFNNMYLEVFPDKNIKYFKQEQFFINKIAEWLNEQPILQCKFEWLTNPSTNKQFVIDAYFPKYNLAIEYNGIQHYKFQPYFHKTQEQFKYKQSIENTKLNLIKAKGINLIVIKYNESIDEVFKSISSFLEDRTISSPQQLALGVGR